MNSRLQDLQEALERLSNQKDGKIKDLEGRLKKIKNAIAEANNEDPLDPSMDDEEIKQWIRDKLDNTYDKIKNKKFSGDDKFKLMTKTLEDLILKMIEDLALELKREKVYSTYLEDEIEVLKKEKEDQNEQVQN